MNGLTRALLAYIRVLKQQRDDARALVVKSRFFQNTVGTEYLWRYPPSEPRKSDMPTNTLCQCHWCNGGGPS